MSRKYTLEEVADIVQIEGLGYAIQHYMSGESIEDPELAQLWGKCAELMYEIERKLEGDH